MSADMDEKKQCSDGKTGRTAMIAIDVFDLWLPLGALGWGVSVMAIEIAGIVL